MHVHLERVPRRNDPVLLHPALMQRLLLGQQARRCVVNHGVSASKDGGADTRHGLTVHDADLRRSLTFLLMRSIMVLLDNADQNQHAGSRYTSCTQATHRAAPLAVSLSSSSRRLRPQLRIRNFQEVSFFMGL